MIKLYIVDDYVMIREGIKDLIDNADDMTIVGEADTGEQLLEEFDNVDPDIIILDLYLPGKGGKEIMLELMKMKPDLPIVFFSMHHDKTIANELMELGAAGYITKDTLSDDILDIIRRVFNGEKYISPTTSFNFDF